MATEVRRKKNYEIDLTEGPLFKKILAFCIPIMLSSLLQSLYNAADVVVVGRFAGPLPLAAVGATGPLITLFLNLFISVAVGTSVTVAVSVGAKNHARTARLVHNSMLLALVFGVLVSLGGVLATDWMLTVMDTPSDIFPMAAAYMRIYLGGAVFSLVYNFGAAVLRAAGDSRRPLYYLAISGAINVLLNLFFVIGLGMDADGVALATVVAQAISAIFVVWALLRMDGPCRLFLRRLRFHGRETWDILRTGLPVGVQSVVFSLSNSIVQKAINSFDTLAIAGNTAAGNLDGFIYTAMFSMNTTAVTAMGQNIGAGRHRALGRIIVICLVLVSLIWLVVGGGILLFARPLLSLYLPQTPQAIEYGLVRMSILTLTYFICGWMDTLVGCSRGMGSTVLPMLVSVIGVCGIRLGWIYTVFAAHHDLTVLYLSYTVSWIVTGLLQLCICLYNRRRMCRILQGKEVLP